MAKKAVELDGLLEEKIRPTDTGIPQRGDEEKLQKAPERRRRLTLALDESTYRRLRLYAAQTDQTHQKILEQALRVYLEKKGA